MNKIIFLILCWSFTTTFAETPSWFPENLEEIDAKCVEESKVAHRMLVYTKDRQTDNLEIQAYLLCKVKALNLYNEDTGLNVDRFAYGYYRAKNVVNGDKSLVLDCVEKNKNVASDGEMICKVIACIMDTEEKREAEKKKMSPRYTYEDYKN